jgi:wyosine [tRNA(Phe)-imidazoG37] synthetase (radical SAM superfamily)
MRQADWVSLKVDTVDTSTWRLINRPHNTLDLTTILNGMLAFASDYKGVLTSETMLVDSINTSDDLLVKVANFLGELAPDTAYLSIPIRPPTVESVRIPDEDRLNRACQIVSHQVARVECLTGYEGNAFASTGDPVRDVLSITAVHPMREEAVRELLAKTASPWSLVQEMVEDGRLRECSYEGRKFYIRCHPRKKR